MAGRIQGITIEIGGNTTKLQKALSDVDGKIKKTQSGLRDVNKLLRMNPGNVELLRQKEALLNKEFNETRERLEQLKGALKQMDAKGVKKTSAEYQALQREIIETENKLKRAEAELKKFGSVGAQRIVAAGNKMSAFGKKVSAAGQQLRGLSMTMGLLTGMAVSVGAEFDQSMSKVQAVSGATGEEFDALRKKAREMGASTKFSANESAEALNYMAMAGWKTDDMLEGLEGVLQLAAASGEDLAATADIVTDGLTAMGYEAGDAGRMANVMAAASSNANTNVSMMGETFKYAASVAGSMNYSMEDLALATGLMANAGIKGSQAGTSLRSMMSRMAAPTDAVAGAMERLGIEITNADGTTKPFREVLTSLRTSMAGLSDTEKTQIASTIAGKNAMSGFLAVVNASDKDFNKLANAIDNSEGAASAMADTMMDNFGGQMTLLKSNLQELSIGISDTLTPAISKLVAIAQKTVSWFNGMSEGGKRAAVAAAGLATAAAPVAIVIGKVAGAVGGLMQKAPQLINFGSKLVGMINPPMLILTALIALLPILYRHSETFRNAANKGLAEIKASFSALWKQLQPALKQLGGALLPVIKKAIDLIGKVAAKLIPIVTKVITTSINRTTAVIGAINKVLSAARSIGGKIYSALAAPFNKIKSTVSSVVSSVKSKLGALKSFKWLKAPHLSISGGKVPFGIGGEGKKPTIGISWYKKAMNNGMILKKATIFGAKNGKLLGGGEAGSEAVIGTNSLSAQITDAVAAGLSGVAGAIATAMQIGMSGQTAYAGPESINVNVSLGGQRVGHEIVKIYDTYKKRLG